MILSFFSFLGLDLTYFLFWGLSGLDSSEREADWLGDELWVKLSLWKEGLRELKSKWQFEVVNTPSRPWLFCYLLMPDPSIWWIFCYLWVSYRFSQFCIKFWGEWGKEVGEKWEGADSRESDSLRISITWCLRSLLLKKKVKGGMMALVVTHSCSMMEI